MTANPSPSTLSLRGRDSLLLARFSKDMNEMSEKVNIGNVEGANIVDG